MNAINHPSTKKTTTFFAGVALLLALTACQKPPSGAANALEDAGNVKKTTVSTDTNAAGPAQSPAQWQGGMG